MGKNNFEKGHKFGELTFIEKVQVPLGDTPKGKFICYCGVEFITRMNSVKNGHTKSCGCYHDKIRSQPKKIFEVGYKINEFTYLGDAPYNKHWARKANFLCTCGKEFITAIQNIENGTTKSCGCMTNKFLSEKGANKEKPIPNLSIDEINRFWDKVDYSMDISKCWNWMANGERYGHFKVNGLQYKSNRVAFYLSNKKDPKELSVMHSCDNPKCCNPSHLSLGTHLENMQDMAFKGRANNKQK